MLKIAKICIGVISSGLMHVGVSPQGTFKRLIDKEIDKIKQEHHSI